jgi:cytohesin
MSGNDGTVLGYTPLIHAVQADSAADVQRLLAEGADVDEGDSIRGTALHHAAVAGQAAMAQILIDAGAGVDARDTAGTTPLIRLAVHADRPAKFASHAESIAYVVAQLTNGIPAQPGVHPLHDAHLATADVLFKAGADPNLIAEDGYSALHHAATNGALPLIERLLAGGAGAGQQNGIGYAPLHAACDASQAGAVRLLLAAGADPDAADDYGFTPLHGAAVQGSTECVEALLAAGASRTPRTTGGYDRVTTGMTPAEAANAYGHTAVADLLTA